MILFTRAFLLCLVLLSPQWALANTITLSTYYPSPSGNFDLLTADNIGLGTTKPKDRLQIIGSGKGFALFGDGGCGVDYTAFNLNGQAMSNCSNYNFLSSPSDLDLDINRPAGAAIRFREDGKDEMVLKSGGDVWLPGSISGGPLASSSDERLKKDITNIIQPLDSLERLRGVAFVWKKDNNKDMGVIAQEVQKVFPDLVTTGPDGMMAVKYNGLVAVLIEAVKAQQQQIDAQAQQIKDLQNKFSHHDS